MPCPEPYPEPPVELTADDLALVVGGRKPGLGDDPDPMGLPGWAPARIIVDDGAPI